MIRKNQPYGYSIHGNARFRDETRHVRMLHDAWDCLERLFWFRIAAIVLCAVGCTAALFGALYFIRWCVRTLL